MRTKITNFINAEDFEVIINSDFPHKKARIIAKSLYNVFIIVPVGDKFNAYVLQDNMTYIHTTLVEAYLKPTITLLLNISFEKLSDGERNQIKDRFSKQYKGIFKGTNTNHYYDETINELIKENVEFNKTLCQIHFNNGYMDLKDLQFKQREISKHYVTNYIDRDYKPSTSEQRTKLLNPLKMIYPDKQDLECILEYLGSALSGISSKDQDTLFLLGLGSSGKSFILSLTDASIGCYFKELKSDTFTLNNAKADKILNTFQNNQQVRITWINELEDARIDTSLFKKFCDGQLTTTILYKDGSFTVPHYSKAIITANTMPNIKVDTGVSRRFRGFTHQANFTDDEALIDNKNHIYKIDKSLLENLIEGNLMDAFFDILADKCCSWLKGKQIKFTKNFDETRDTVLLSNDWIQDFIDVNLKITNNPDDRISKNVMLDVLKCQYPQKFINPMQLITALKDKKISYNAKLRCDKLQGCYIGVVFQSDLEEDLQDMKDPLDKGIVKDDYKVKYENAKKENEELKKQLQQLQQPKEELKAEPKEEIKVEPKQKRQPKTTKQPKNVVINEIKETSINSLLSIKSDADAMDEMIELMRN
jgi:hypothetical protein